MSKESTQIVSGSFPLVGILTIIFVLAKLGGAVTWSWWWVFAPVWIGGAIGVLIFLFLLIFIAIVAVIGCH